MTIRRGADTTPSDFLSAVVRDCQELTDKVEARLVSLGIARDELLQLDHFGIRAESLEQYRTTVGNLAASARWVHESEVNGRPISVLLLVAPISIGTWVTPFLEVIAPKPGRDYAAGVEHAEFVTALPLDDFIAAHPGLDFDRSGMAKSLNPALSVRDDQVSFRFHQVSLGVVVALEKALSQSPAVALGTSGLLG